MLGHSILPIRNPCCLCDLPICRFFQKKFRKRMLVCGLIWKQYVMSSLMFSNYGDAVNYMHARSCSKLWYWNIKQRMCYITLNNNFSVKWPSALLMIWLVAWVPIENVTVPKRAFSPREVALVIIWSSKAWGKMVNTKFNADRNLSYTIFFMSTYIFVKFMILFTKQSTHFSDRSSRTI